VIGIPLTRKTYRVRPSRDRADEASRSCEYPESGWRSTVLVDVLDRDGLLRAVKRQSADAIIHELTVLKTAPARHRGMAPTDRLRIDGTANLLAAPEAIGATTFLTQLPASPH
jgi:hypothetical protein